MDTPEPSWQKPSINELGLDLLQIGRARRAVAVVVPFICFIAYFVLAAYGQRSLAVLAVVVLSFVTYGSVCHDLVHANLHLPRRLNRLLLGLLEMLMLRSGTVYRIVHLNHHAKYPDTDQDDPEGAAARFGLIRTIGEGILFQFKLGRWAWQRASIDDRRAMRAEWCGIGVLVLASLAAVPFTLIPIGYCALAYMGSWIIPLVTSYLVHRPDERDVLHQTRLYRGAFYSLVSFDHLYHLEHHLYTQVPHQNWKRLARRLDPYFAKAGVTPQRIF